MHFRVKRNTIGFFMLQDDVTCSWLRLNLFLFLLALEFLRSNPACTHRLVRWLARDLRALLNDEESRASSVLENIRPLINK